MEQKVRCGYCNKEFLVVQQDKPGVFTLKCPHCQSKAVVKIAEGGVFPPIPPMGLESMGYPPPTIFPEPSVKKPSWKIMTVIFIVAIMVLASVYIVSGRLSMEEEEDVKLVLVDAAGLGFSYENFRITVTVKNVGEKIAEEEKIMISFTAEERIEYNWTSGDIKPGEFVKDTFTVPITQETNTIGVGVYYKGHLEDASVLAVYPAYW